MCSHDERSTFFDALLARCTDYRSTCLTLTAIHPDGKHPTPSRHIRLDDAPAWQDAFVRLDAANALGWGAFFAVGLRRPGLTRWKRGGSADVVALPAMFVDVDDPSVEALTRLRCACPAPSCLVFSGGGFHAYWWLDEPTTDLDTARVLLRGLASALDGDRLSPAQSMRLVGSRNPKPGRNGAVCTVLEMTDRRYRLDDFATYRPPRSAYTVTRAHPETVPVSSDQIEAIVNELERRSFKPRGDWLNGSCPFPTRHRHADARPSFGFNTKLGYGYCHVCGRLQQSDILHALHADYTTITKGT